MICCRRYWIAFYLALKGVKGVSTVDHTEYTRVNIIVICIK